MVGIKRPAEYSPLSKQKYADAESQVCEEGFTSAPKNVYQGDIGLTWILKTARLT